MSPPPDTQTEVVVLGSINVDYVVEVPHRPAGGETIVGADVRLLPGGKGANQAVAVAHAGGRVAMVGCVGADPDGDLARDALAGHGVDVRRLATVAGARTGNAYIFVTPDGENSIAVASGANRRVDPAAALQATAELRPRVVLLQGELPSGTTAALLEGVHGDAHVVVNLAPVLELPEASRAHWDTLVVNAGEAAALLGRDALGEMAPHAAAAALRRRPDQAVVITLGPDGAVAVDATGEVAVAAPVVDVVDTTGAGDAFVGVLALALARGAPLRSAVEAGVEAGARAVGYMGAQPPPR
jgi:ribokinase